MSATHGNQCKRQVDKQTAVEGWLLAWRKALQVLDFASWFVVVLITASQPRVTAVNQLRLRISVWEPVIKLGQRNRTAGDSETLLPIMAGMRIIIEEYRRC